MHGLHEIYASNPSKSTSLDLLSVVGAAPALETLTLDGINISDVPQDLSLPRLRTLRILCRERLGLLGGAPVGIYDSKAALLALDAEAACLENLLNHIHPSIEHLVLPAETAHFDRLRGLSWPNLRSLELYGVWPRRSERVAWLHVLATMPRLVSLKLIAAFYLGDGPLVIWPKDAEPNAAGLFDASRLRELALSHVDPDDLIFAHLSSNISALSLRDTPRFYQRREKLCLVETQHNRIYPDSRIRLACTFGTPLMRYSDILSIFASMSGDNIESLELVVREDHNELAALALLARSCPKLRLLELHRYRDVDDEIANKHGIQEPQEPPDVVRVPARFFAR